jgi:hypothetical protein
VAPVVLKMFHNLRLISHSYDVLNLPCTKGDYKFPLLKKGGRGDFQLGAFLKRIQHHTFDLGVTLH